MDPRPQSGQDRSPGRSWTGGGVVSAATGTELGAGRALGPAFRTGRGPRRIRRRKHRTGQAHARDDRRRGTLAAFGGAFADALHRLARGRALEAAGQLRVLDVATVLLECLLVFRLDRDHEVAPPGDAAA